MRQTLIRLLIVGIVFLVFLFAANESPEFSLLAGLVSAYVFEPAFLQKT